MLELPEVITLSRQLEENVAGRKVVKVLPPSKEHKFCWYNGDPADYNDAVKGKQITSAQGFGIFVDLTFENGMKLAINDGTNCRIVKTENLPKAYQLAIELDDGTSLVYTVAMYGGIIMHDDSYDNEYYMKSKEAVFLLSDGLPKLFETRLKEAKPSLSAKAFLATEQRFCGLGNGVLQDILLSARLNPRTKISSLSAEHKDCLMNCVSSVLSDMTVNGGRDTERDLFGTPGGYKTIMSKNNVDMKCPLCGSDIVKEAYMGGSVYYCPKCQPKV